MKYDVDYFINKFKAIPLNKWCCDDYINEDGKCCALGHLGLRDFSGTSDETTALEFLLDFKVPEINDGFVYKYKQSNPRSRILAALNDIKQAKKDKK